MWLLHDLSDGLCLESIQFDRLVANSPTARYGEIGEGKERVVETGVDHVKGRRDKCTRPRRGDKEFGRS